VRTYRYRHRQNLRHPKGRHDLLGGIRKCKYRKSHIDKNIEEEILSTIRTQLNSIENVTIIKEHRL